MDALSSPLGQLRALRVSVDAALEDALPDAGDPPHRIHAAMRYAVLSPGKRLRPLLTLLSASHLGCSAAAALPGACALEFVHAASLVFDDLPCMDNSDTRRGQPSLHVRYGEDVAVLTGIAFQACVTAFTATQEDSTSLTTLFRFVITPLFLFSGTFFPITNLPPIFQWVAYATPLFHGVELVRKIALPGLSSTAVTSIPIWVHFAYLVVMASVGLFLAARFLNKRLRP